MDLEDLAAEEVDLVADLAAELVDLVEEAVNLFALVKFRRKEV